MKFFYKILIKLDDFNIIKLNDTQKINLEFKYYFGYKPNLNNPKSFNEKLQWLKLNDRKDDYSLLVDKCEVKKIISNLIGEEYIIRTIGIYDNFDEIDFGILPNKFVIKCTHDSGGVIICKNKNNLDLKSIKKKINHCLKHNYYLKHREWPYKNVKPRIIIEEYLSDTMNDYKFQCFNGKIDSVFVCEGRNTKNGVRYYYFDSNWNYLNYCDYKDIDNKNFDLLKPKNYDKMVKIVNIICEKFKQVRVDLYNIDGKIYFGEITFFTNAGYDTTISKEADLLMGERLILDDEV